MSTERDNLEIHVDLCTERYKQLEYRLNSVEHKITEINRDLADFKGEMRHNFDEIKGMLTAAKDQKFTALVGASATVIVALIGMLGYIIIHLPK